MGEPSFSPALFAFLEELARNNDRAWFKANRQRYEDAAQEPALAFISGFAPRLRTISPHLAADARPVGGSLHRIQRDLRFSRDKSPYRTNIAVRFPHERSRGVQAPTSYPSYYLHLAPGEVFAGAGVWHPDSATLGRIRDAIVARPGEWRAAAHGGAFAARFRLTGESLVRPPRGYDPAHPLIEDLKRKDFVASAPLSEAAVTSPGFVEELAGLCQLAAPFMRFLCEALDLPF
jgi:uncharacterized protein (TIGR02453 family)